MLIDAAGWTWIVVIVLLVIGGSLFLNKLMSKGVFEESTQGRSRLNSAFSELQTLVDPAHRYVIEERDHKRSEHDNAGDGSEQTS